MESSWRELRIEECRQALQGMRDTHRQALEYVENPGNLEALHQELLEIHQACQTYTPQQPATAAVYILAQVAWRIEKLVAPMQIVQAYQTLHDKLRDLEQL